MPPLHDLPPHPQPSAQDPRSLRAAGGLKATLLAGLLLSALTAAALTHGCAGAQPQPHRAEPPPARPPLTDERAMQIARALASAEVITPLPPTSASSSTTSAATQDAQAVLQAIVDLDALAPFLHPEAPGRVPLTLAIPSAPPGIALSRFGQPVHVVASAPGGDAPCLEITALELQRDRATVSFAYAREGVVGSAELSRSQGRWAVVRRSVAER